MSFQPAVYPGSIYGIGVGSVYAQIGAPATIGSLAVQGVLGSVAISSQASWDGIGSVHVANSVQPLIGSVYGIGVGSMYVQVGAPATIGSLAVQGVLGSVAISSLPSVQPLIGSVYGIGVGSIAVAIIGTPAFTGLIQGNAGHDVADTGSPVGIGLQARTTNPTAVSDVDRVRGIADDIGRQVVLMHHVRDLVVLPGSPAQLTASGTAVRLLGSGAAGVFHDAIALYMTNTGSVNTTVFITDATGSASNHIFTLAAGGGAVIHPLSAWPQRWSNSHWDATLNLATNSPVYIELQGVKNV